MATIRKELVYRKFDVIAHLFGWDHIGPRWMPDPAWPHKQRAVVGRVWFEKHGRANRYSIVEMTNDLGGEHDIRGYVSGEELCEWMDGCLHAAGIFANDKMSAAWAASNECKERTK